MPDLGSIWFVLIGVLLLGYAVLDGFDLGVGIIQPYVARSDDERHVVHLSIGPVWDGNEVWLLTAGGALFAAFPLVYATVFSGFYLALVLLLGALIVRAVAIEFGEQLAAPGWRNAWSWAFVVGSLLPPILLGVAVGNVIRGLPLDADGLYRGGLIGLLTPFPLLVGLLVAAFAATHGALWLVVKTEGEVAARARRAATAGWLVEAGLWVVTTAAAPFLAPGHWAVIGQPIGWLGPIVAAVGLAGVPLALRGGRSLVALAASAVAMAGMIGTLGAGLYPNLVPALDEPARSLTIARAASSDLSLTVMLAIAVVAVPMVLAYTAFIYWRFRGKVQPDEGGYSG